MVTPLQASACHTSEIPDWMISSQAQIQIHNMSETALIDPTNITVRSNNSTKHLIGFLASCSRYFKLFRCLLSTKFHAVV